MKIVNLTSDKYQEWNDFCMANDDAWFFHTSHWLEYTLNYRPELETKNLGFMLYKEKELIAVVPLTLEINEFSFGGGKIPMPVLKNFLAKETRDIALQFIYECIDRLALENEVLRISLKEDPLSISSFCKFHSNSLLKHGYIDVSLNTQLIDLSKTEVELWDDLRRNHHRNIQKARDKKFKLIVYTAENITKDIFNTYKEMHHRAAGRKTRPDKTFELMFDWIKKDLAFLMFVELEGKLIGCEYYLAYKKNVYGASAANEPEYEHLPVRHFLEWEGILWMKKRGFLFYEIGLQQYGTLPYDFPDEKQLNISHFKKGFGGVTVPLFMGEKYYDKEYFLKVYNHRINKFAEKFNEKNGE